MLEHKDRTIAYSGALIDAQRAWSALIGHGIPADLVGQHSGAAYTFASVLVVVRADSADAARQVLEESGLLHRPQNQ